MGQPRQTSPWIAFAAGAAAMLAVALVLFVWMQRRAGADLAEAAADATQVVPALEMPPMPDAPRIPDVPIPRPK